MKNNVEKGNLYVIAAPSGTGKTTLVKALIDSTPNITVSISHTTRPKRANEQDNVDYHFIDQDEFNRMIAHGDFLEYAVIFDNHYGTSKTWVENTLTKGLDVILEIDWQGNAQIKQIFPETIGIFILPPSLNDLKSRLVKRNQDHPEIINKRLADAQATIMHLPDFEYLILNDDFSHALKDLQTLISANRLKRQRQMAKHCQLINDFVKLQVNQD